MKDYRSDRIHNIALVGHSGAGKTTLTEAALYLTKVTTRMGKTEDGNTVSDFDPEEVRRGISISTSLIPVEWDGHKINFLDTPGYADFVGEVITALAAADYGVVVVDAVAGVEVGTELTWQALDDLGLPRMVVINKMDRDNASAERTLASLREHFPEVRFTPMVLPVGQKAAFQGVYRLNSGKPSLGAEGKEGAVPDDVMQAAATARMTLVEAAAEGEDELMMKYFDEGDLSPDDVRHGLPLASRAGKFVPVLMTAASDCRGVLAFLETLKYLAPTAANAMPRTAVRQVDGKSVDVSSDDPHLAALVVKTQADPYVGKLQYLRVISGEFKADSRVMNLSQNQEERVGPVYVLRGKEQLSVGHLYPGDIGAVAKLQHTHTGDTLGDKDTKLTFPPFNFPQPLYSVAVKPSTQADGVKLGQALQRMAEEDRTLVPHFEDATHELLLSGMGDSHIAVAVHHLKDKYGVSVETKVPRVPYRETVTRPGKAQYRHKKQTGGSGQFAEVHLRVEPLPAGGGFEFASEVFGGAISHQYIPSIEKGVVAVMKEGVIAHCPVVDIKAIVTDGREHPVDSKDIAFQIAGREAFKEAMQEAGPVLLEPVYRLKVIVPAAQMGDVLGDMNTRRGVVQGTELIGTKAVVSAQAPQAEIQRYATDLRSMTQGRGYFTAEFDHFAQVPFQITEKVLAEAKAAAEHH